jgi:molybdopterin converting factor small subunit
MDILVHFESQLRQAAGVEQVTVSVPDKCCVADALQIIGQHLGRSLSERIVAEDGTPQRSVLIFVNDRAIAHQSAGSHQLKSGDALLLYPPISGG